jgi:hypothetical protein
MEILSRDEALEKGLKRYFTGKPCKRGHVSERFTVSKNCVGCHYRKEGIKGTELRLKLYADPRIITRDAAIAQGKTRYYTGVPCHKGHLSERQVTDHSCMKCSCDKSKDYSKKNSDKVRKWALVNYYKNPVPYKIRATKRRAEILLRTPKWADETKIKDTYELCEKTSSETGIPHEVDHIIPLKGELVSGLHVHENLRVISRFENRTKYNKFDIEEYNASNCTRINSYF